MAMIAPRYLHPLQELNYQEIEQGKKFWGYLDTEALKSRYVLAAYYLEDCKNIIEIGGYRSNVITNFLTSHHDSVTVYSLDVEFEEEKHWSLNGKVCRVEHIRDFVTDNPHSPYKLGVVALGLEFIENRGVREPKLNYRYELLALLKKAKVVILEVAIDNKKDMAFLDDIVKELPQPLFVQIDLDLSANEVLLKEELKNSINPPYWNRRMLIFKDTEEEKVLPIIDIPH